MPNTKTTNQESVDKIDEILKRFSVFSTGNEAVEANPEYAFSEAREQIQKLLVEAEGRGRVAVLSNLKEWADDTEVTYNKLIETELDTVAQLSKENR